MNIQELEKKIGGVEQPISSKIETPEKDAEKSLEKIIKQKKEDNAGKEYSSHIKVSADGKKIESAELKDDMTIQIEKVLEEDLEEVYFNMPPEKQKKFKEKGEETANNIRELMKAIQIKIKEIIKLIVDWLKIIPEISGFFIEQEAKIKADKILNIKNPK